MVDGLVKLVVTPFFHWEQKLTFFKCLLPTLLCYHAALLLHLAGYMLKYKNADS